MHHIRVHTKYFFVLYHQRWKAKSHRYCSAISHRCLMWCTTDVTNVASLCPHISTSSEHFSEKAKSKQSKQSRNVTWFLRSRDVSALWGIECIHCQFIPIKNACLITLTETHLMITACIDELSSKFLIIKRIDTNFSKYAAHLFKHSTKENIEI